jgi:undecaprenol kinase
LPHDAGRRQGSGLPGDAPAMKGRPFRQRLGFALAGVAAAWRGEASFRSQVALAAGAAVITAALRPGLVWAAVVAVSIALVLALELVNSALEAILDHLHPDEASAVRRAKDMAAAGVLAASAGAAVAGLLMVASVAFGW